MKTQTFTLKTERQGYYDITRTVREAVRESGIQSGIAIVFCPHTWANRPAHICFFVFSGFCSPIKTPPF